MDFILIHSKAEETISAFSLEMLTRCFCENAKKGDA